MRRFARRSSVDEAVGDDKGAGPPPGASNGFRPAVRFEDGFIEVADSLMLHIVSRRLPNASAGYGGVVTEAISAVPGAPRWSYGPFEFDREAQRRTVPLVRDDGTPAVFTIPEFVSEPRDLAAIAHIVIAACERWENRQGVGG